MKRNYESYTETLKSLKNLEVEKASLQQKLLELEAADHFHCSEKKVKKNDNKPSTQTTLNTFFQAAPRPQNQPGIREQSSQEALPESENNHLKKPYLKLIRHLSIKMEIHQHKLNANIRQSSK